MFHFLALLAFSVSCEYSRADTYYSDESVACSNRFILNPKDTDRETFLDQFKPCGWYKKNCRHKFRDWFGEDGGFTLSGHNFFKPNVCYPGRGRDDLFRGINLVQFDIGLDETHYEAALGLENEPLDRILIDDIDGGERNYLTFPKNQAGEYFQRRNMEFGETCIETFAKTLDHWGRPEFGGNYGCMGKCGPGCGGVGLGRDCMKHDVCSYFKTIALKEETENFCRDFDCGDEAAQTVINCKEGNARGPQMICERDSFVDINPAARLQSQKRACILRSKWERNQGMPWLRKVDGTICDTFDDCQSRRCDRSSGRRRCIPRLGDGELCNEDSDCISVVCRRLRRNHRRRCQTRGFLEIGQRCDEDLDCHSLVCNGTCRDEDEAISFNDTTNLRGGGRSGINDVELEQF